MDPIMDSLLKGGVSLGAVVLILWLTVKAVAGYIATRLKSAEDSLNAAHAESRKECREDNLALAKRLGTVEDEGRKNTSEEKLVLIRAIDTSNRLVEKVLDRFPDITPPKGNRNL